ncbi:alpha/beta hydrolase [Bordetella genomosp. 9]|uniref:Esterase n=1 Tax=Bordetella genomosp. 9 TaxID=1416803 RepID=A0A1W6Z3P7_9BORD|nr:alpha/beta hydrolase [Bordetella genomosp. 9]ARP87990.1 esterase [Bordetella genomosp. 9]
MAILYRDYDRAALDIQYNARATAPDFGAIMREYAEQSRHARETLPCALNVAYGPHPDETLDIFPAAAGGPAPVFVFIHGGYWRLLSKDDSSAMAPAFTRAGAAVVALNYSLAPAVTLDHIVDQVRRAMAWLHRNIAAHGGDPGRLHVGGSSAGGHLVGMLLNDDWQQRYGVPADVLRGAAPLSGLFDLTPLVHTHINEWMRLTPESAARNSPMLHLPARPCPVVASYGESETDEFKRQTMDYLDALRARGGDARYVPMPGTNHFDIVLRLNDPAAPITRAIFAQMGLAPGQGRPDAGAASSTGRP